MKYTWENFKNLFNGFIDYIKELINLLIIPHIEAFKFNDMIYLPILIFDIIIILIIITMIIKSIIKYNKK